MKHVERRPMALLMAVAAILALAAGCGRVGEHGRIGVVYLNAEGYYAGVERGLRATLGQGERDPQLVQINVQSDAAKESSFINTMSSAKVDALIVSPASATASIPA